MAKLPDRIKDVTLSTGTGSIVLEATPPVGYQSFETGYQSISQNTDYCISDPITGDWEVVHGVFNGTTGLTRVVTRASSNSNNPVSFASGSKDVFVTASGQLISGANVGRQSALTRNYSLP